MLAIPNVVVSASSMSSSPPNTPTPSEAIPLAVDTQACHCSVVPVVGSLNANTLADSLGVSPLYKQQDSARWTSAAQVYKTSRAVSPTGSSPFVFPEVVNPVITTQQLVANIAQQCSSAHRVYSRTRRRLPRSTSYRIYVLYSGGEPCDHDAFYTFRFCQHFIVYLYICMTPFSLEDIAAMNRRRHEEEGGVVPSGAGGPLELEAVAAVHELATEVNSISVSEMLPRTSDLIFVNVKTQEGQPYTLELTMKGWRIASSHTDCMNGDYTKVELHTRYFANARELLSVVSPDHATRFNECVAAKLKQLEQEVAGSVSVN